MPVRREPLARQDCKHVAGKDRSLSLARGAGYGLQSLFGFDADFQPDSVSVRALRPCRPQI